MPLGFGAGTVIRRTVLEVYGAGAVLRPTAPERSPHNKKHEVRNDPSQQDLSRGKDDVDLNKKLLTSKRDQTEQTEELKF
mgnify:CR=1 FL=1